MKNYHQLCSSDDCFTAVMEDDIERNAKDEIYERSKRCWDCRTKKDRLAIKRWRQKQCKLTLNNQDDE